MATWSTEFYEWTLSEDIVIKGVHAVVDGSDHQLILGEGEEVLQDAGSRDGIINWLYYEVAGKK